MQGFNNEWNLGVNSANYALTFAIDAGIIFNRDKPKERKV